MEMEIAAEWKMVMEKVENARQSERRQSGER